MRALASILIVVTWGGVAQAQGLLEPATPWSWPDSARPAGAKTLALEPSPKEIRYGSTLAASLGSEGVEVERIGQTFAPPGRRGPQTARGVRVRTRLAIEVDQRVVADERSAFEYALYGAEIDRRNDALVEARGRSVVVARGPGLEDPVLADRVLEAAWNRALPFPSGRQTLSAVRARDGGLMILTAHRDPRLDAFLKRVLEGLEARSGARGMIVEAGARRGRASFRLANGENGMVHIARRGSVLVRAHSDLQRAYLDVHHARARRAPQEGARGRLRRLFD